MYFFIFGFHRLVWCPKWTPASSSCFIVMTEPSPFAMPSLPPSVWGWSSGRSAPPHPPRRENAGAPRGEARPWGRLRPVAGVDADVVVGEIRKVEMVRSFPQSQVHLDPVRLLADLPGG